MKTFSVIYKTTLSQEAIVKAKNIDAAKKKVLEVICQPVEITDAWEVKE